MSKRKYTPELVQAIEARYDGSTAIITDLQNQFNVPRYTITSTAAKLGKSKPKKNWTKEEEEILRDNWGHKTIPQIAKILNRTKTSIIVKYKRLGLEAPTKAGDMMTARAVSDLLGVDIHTVTDVWIPKHGLKAKKTAMRGTRKMTMIHFDHLIKWLKLNQHLRDSRKVELYAFGSEPDWLKEKRKTDNQKTIKRAVKWTLEEDAKAILLFKQGNLTYAQIGEQLNRSASAVEHRINRLDVWGTGKFVGDRKHQDGSGKFEQLKEKSKKKLLLTRLAELVQIRKNQLDFDGYWQKSMCINWNDIKGCKAGQAGCDDCVEFIRIREQYCKRCGVTFYSRQLTDFCEPCRASRKKKHQKKWAIINNRRK